MTTISRHEIFSFAIFSGCTLFLEISLTRLLSTLFFPQTVYAVISIAILGIGLGAALATWKESLRRYALVPGYMAATGIATIIVLVIVLVSASYSVQLLGIELTDVFQILVIAIPYFFVGMTLAALFSNRGNESNRMYAADLIGAGLGAIAVIPLLNAFGAINGILLAGLLLAGTAIVFALPRLHVFSILVAGLIGLVLVTNLFAGWLDVDFAANSTAKPVKSILVNGGETVSTRWDAFARTDVVQPANGGPLQMYVDGAAGSVVPAPEHRDLLIRDIGFFPFATAQPESVLVIGPGGGMDVWFGLQSGAELIHGLEVNPASVALVEELRDVTGELYDHPTVTVEVDEGRSALRRDARLYDLIFLSQVVTLTAERDGLTLVENTIYTIEAFEDYLNRLTEDGQIALKLYDEPTLTRALSTVMATFRQRGLSDVEALSHVAVFLDPSQNIPLLLINRQPFTENDALAYGAVAQDVGFVPLFLPGVLAQPPLDSVADGSMSFQEIVEQSTIDISPTNDNRPYFFQFEIGLPDNLKILLLGAGVLVLITAITLIAVQRKVNSRVQKWSPLYFAGLGIGFMLAEIAILQQTQLFLGHPTVAITTVLTTLLVVGGIGSLASGRWLASRSTGFPVWLLPVLAGVMILWFIAWTFISNAYFKDVLVIRIAVTVLSILPVAFVLGMPFPLGLRMIAKGESRHIALAWAVNGLMTVVGSILAVSLAVMFGFQSVMIAAIFCYSLLAVLVPTISRRGASA